MPIATAARVGGSSGYQVEAMEGFGVLRAAELAGVPALEVPRIKRRAVYVWRRSGRCLPVTANHIRLDADECLKRRTLHTHAPVPIRTDGSWSPSIQLRTVC
jgi:hypothetical protein